MQDVLPVAVEVIRGEQSLQRAHLLDFLDGRVVFVDRVNERETTQLQAKKSEFGGLSSVL